MPQTAPGSAARLPGPKLSLKQAQSIGQSTAKINLWEGAVRSGKTVASLIRWATYCADPPVGGSLVVTGKTFDTVYRNVFGVLMDRRSWATWRA
jgi:hypothetical protein